MGKKSYRGAGVMLFRYNRKYRRFEVLLGKRSIPRGYGKWAIVGGGMEGADDGYEACAYREFREETGVDLRILLAKKLAVSKTDVPFFHWRTYMILTWGPCPALRPDRENLEFAWFPLEAVGRQNLWISLNREIRAFRKLVRKHALVIAYHTGMPFDDEKLLAAYRVLTQVKFRTRDTVARRIREELNLDVREAVSLSRRLEKYYVESEI